MEKETRKYTIIASQEWFDKWEELIREYYEDSKKVIIKNDEDTIDNNGV
jgi:predicted DNA binding protein